MRPALAKLSKDKDADVVAFVEATEGPNFNYPDYAARFDATFFNATQWLELCAASGAKYVVPTSKHHEGFCNWPSATAFNWNSFDVGPHRDIVGELANATREAGLHFGLYHSLFEWYNPLYDADRSSNWSTNNFVTGKTMPELYDLVERYRPEIIWSDGDWESDWKYWNSTAFLAWLANDSPVKDTVVWNDRWGGGADSCLCHHGAYYTCADRFLPSSLVGHAWENAFTLDTQSWGYRRNAVLGDYMTTAEVIATVVQTVAFGGNALINIGPAHDGSIDPIFVDRLTGLGVWLATNGEAIYATTPWSVAQNDTAASAFYTAATAAAAPEAAAPAAAAPAPAATPAGGAGTAASVVYAILLAWPPSGAVTLVAPTGAANATTVTLIGNGATQCAWQPRGAAGAPGIVVTMPAIAPGSALGATSAWVLRIVGLADH